MMGVLLTSCDNNDMPLDTNQGQAGTKRFLITADMAYDMSSRSDYSSHILEWALYDSSRNILDNGVLDPNQGQWSLTVTELNPEEDYFIVFFAHNIDSGLWTFDSTSATVEIDYAMIYDDMPDYHPESLSSFLGKCLFSPNGEMVSVNLKRPYAEFWVGTNEALTERNQQFSVGVFPEPLWQGDGEFRMPCKLDAISGVLSGNFYWSIDEYSQSIGRWRSNAQTDEENSLPVFSHCQRAFLCYLLMEGENCMSGYMDPYDSFILNIYNPDTDTHTTRYLYATYDSNNQVVPWLSLRNCRVLIVPPCATGGDGGLFDGGYGDSVQIYWGEYDWGFPSYNF